MNRSEASEFKAELSRIRDDRLARDNETDVDELGFLSAKAEWDEFELKCVHPRPFTRLLWNQLTLGDQERYGRLELANSGVNIKVDHSRAVIDLPDSYGGLSANEIKWLNDAVAECVSKTLVQIRIGRRWGVADIPAKTNGLAGLF